MMMMMMMMVVDGMRPTPTCALKGNTCVPFQGNSRLSGQKKDLTPILASNFPPPSWRFAPFIGADFLPLPPLSLCSLDEGALSTAQPRVDHFCKSSTPQQNFKTPPSIPLLPARRLLPARVPHREIQIPKFAPPIPPILVASPSQKKLENPPKTLQNHH
mmetsp:Transcript_16377/g.35408  ORF Transcript_16377/g.35408 Transcript_16377/m.35408 type:complete len:159 (-) Transcript_16377:36-512(-)